MNKAAGNNNEIKVFVMVKLIPFLLLFPLIRRISLKPSKYVLVK